MLSINSFNYQAINPRVCTKYLAGFSVANARGYNIVIHNRKGEPMFTVRPNGTAYRGNTDITIELQSSVLFKGTDSEVISLSSLLGTKAIQIGSYR